MIKFYFILLVFLILPKNQCNREQGESREFTFKQLFFRAKLKMYCQKNFVSK